MSAGSDARPRFIVVAAAVAVGVLLIVLAFGGAGTQNPRSSTSAVTFAQANDLALRQLGPGTWVFFGAFGFDPWNGTTLNSTSGGYPPNCTVRSQPPVPPPALVIPSYRGNLSDGTAVVWVLEYINPAAQTLAAVLLVGGLVTDLLTLSGPHCSLFPVQVQPVSWNLVDSSVAARALGQNGGDAFLASHRNGTSLTMSIIAPLAVNGTVPSSPVWLFSYTPCSGFLQGNFTGPTNGTEFNGVVNATSGAVLNASSTTVNCQSFGSIPPPNPTPTIFSVFGLGGASVVVGPGSGGTIASQGCTSGDYCYELPVTVAQQNVSPSDMALWITNGSSSSASPVPRGFAFLDLSGRVLVYSMGPSAFTWTNGSANATVPLTAGDTLTIDMGPAQPAGLGYMLQLEGLGLYSGSGESMSLP